MSAARSHLFPCPRRPPALPWGEREGTGTLEPKTDLSPHPTPTARTLEVDNEVMEKFNRALKTLPVHMQLLNPTQAEGEHPTPHTSHPCFHSACGSPARQL